jgi:GDP-D-mannose dehydratase
MTKRALITEITARDSAHLAKRLLEDDYENRGSGRRSGLSTQDRLDSL